MARTVTLVDTAGSPTGIADLLDAHTGKGKLHKAFSVYVFNPKKTAMLIQQRSTKKMLWPLIWANTCCSHPYEHEEPQAAGERRLQEELGFSCKLRMGSSFVYRAEDPAGKGVEHEHVTILLGEAKESIPLTPDLDEVAAWKWKKIDELQREFEQNPEMYTPWFKLGLKKILENC
jgi:isopentenyl-diphosphate delta-isomerase